MPYHDLRHSLDTALVVARLVTGYQRHNADRAAALSPDAGVLGVVLGLLQDTGYIRKRSKTAVCSPQLTANHEARSVEFAEAWLRIKSLVRYADLAGLILTTRLATDLVELLANRPPWVVALGKMLGAADLLSQMTDPVYLERCYWHLYPELVLAGADRARGPDGEEQFLLRDAFDLVRKTPMFYEHVVRKRLDGDFGDVYRHLPAHYLYATALAASVERAAAIAAEGRRDRLTREPAKTTRDLPPFYRAHAARCAACG
jgi:hypothetical protein